MSKSSKKQLIEWGGIVALFVILFTTDLGTELSGLLKRGMLKTGLLNASVEELNATGVFVKEDIMLVNTSGQTINFQDLPNQPTLVKFWASWCPSCIAELPGLNKLFNEGVAFNMVLVSVDADREKLLRFLKKKNYDFPVYQLGSSYPEVFRGSTIPRSYILDSNQQIVFKKSGMINFDTEDFQTLIHEL